MHTHLLQEEATPVSKTKKKKKRKLITSTNELKYAMYDFDIYKHYKLILKNIMFLHRWEDFS